MQTSFEDPVAALDVPVVPGRYRAVIGSHHWGVLVA
jgi:hypothetical protein